MGEIPGTYDRVREKRDRYLRLLGLSLLVIVIGLLTILTFPWWRIVLIVMLVPTGFGGYATGVYLRNVLVEYLDDKGYEYEDADLWSLIFSVIGGLLGTIVLGGLQVLFVLLLGGLGIL